MRTLFRMKAFLLESREEFKRVNWPTRQETIKMVFVVLGISAVVAVFLGALDFLFLSILERIL